ncbi:MAG: AEC family transporter [Lachnospiraceae bacterium]|nr:AEC family transporter [Lachnospiraceae bacterium]
MLLLKQMIILFLLMAVGFICKKRGILTAEGSKCVSAIVVNVANPALVLSASINKESTIMGMDLLKTVGLALGVYVVLIVLAYVIPHLLRCDKKTAKSYRVMTVFSNIGFMGFPLLNAMYGSTSLLYASIFTIPYNVLIYTWCISTLDDSDGNIRGIAWGKIFNIGVIACIATIIIYLFRIPMPEFVETTVNHLSGLTAPLSMIIIGGMLADMELKSLFTDIRLIIFMAAKLIIIPIIGIVIIRLLGVDDMLLGVCLVMLATPVGSMTAMLAKQYTDNSELVVKGVALSTLLSVATMPLVSWFLSM